MGKKKKKKLRFKGLILLILLVYLIGMSAYYLFSLPIKNIEIKGNNYISESEVIDALSLSKKTSLLKIKRSTLSKKLDKFDLIEKFTIKKSIFGKLTITLDEYKPLYYNVLTKKVMLESGKEIEADYIIGLPTLVNYMTSDNTKAFVKNFSKVEQDVIMMISEIQVDNDRYILRMNDNNTVYINNSTLEKLNKYPSIYEKFGNNKIIDLDSVDNDSNKYIITSK